MASSKVQANHVIRGYEDAKRAFDSSPQAQQKANAIKVCNNTYLVCESDNAPNLPRISYALTFHGSKIIRYHSDGSYSLNSFGFRTATTKHRFNQFTPFAVSQRAGGWYITAEHPTFASEMAFMDGMRVIADSRTGYLKLVATCEYCGGKGWLPSVPEDVRCGRCKSTGLETLSEVA